MMMFDIQLYAKDEAVKQILSTYIIESFVYKLYVVGRLMELNEI